MNQHKNKEDARSLSDSDNPTVKFIYRMQMNTKRTTYHSYSNRLIYWFSWIVIFSLASKYYIVVWYRELEKGARKGWSLSGWTV